MLTPPLVIIASSIGLKPFIVSLKSFKRFTSFSLSNLVISFTGFSGFIPDNCIIGSIIFCGNNFSKLFLNCLFLNSSKSLITLSSSFSFESAGFKSICKTILLFFNNSSIFLYLTK